MYKGEEDLLRLISQKGKLGFEELVKSSGMNEDSVRRILESLKGGGFISVESLESVAGSPTEELKAYLSSGFPEESVFRKALAGASVSDLSQSERSIGIRWAKTKGFVEIESGKLKARKDEGEIKEVMDALRQACQEMIKSGASSDAVLSDELFQRRLLEKRSIRSVTVTYTGKEIPVLEGGFDVLASSSDAPMGKNHPITRLSQRIRSIMSEMGFEEMEGDIIESSFWNFDALFQPQDHPARELADTFYLDGEAPLPSDEKLVSRVKKAHEDGWKYRWDPKEAKKLVLRTHTTALSARHVAAIKDKKPKKLFAIGRVFRNEATDYKHLAEFHQVEGIIAWEGARFTDLLGILKVFYSKLGFEKIRFRPSFFPYTEPSLEIEVYYEKRKQWMELGGAGIFRPEVSIPLSGTYPVLAWGLSLERPLMLSLDLEDIRTFYRNDMDFLKSARLDL